MVKPNADRLCERRLNDKSRGQLDFFVHPEYSGTSGEGPSPRVLSWTL